MFSGVCDCNPQVSVHHWAEDDVEDDFDPEDEFNPEKDRRVMTKCWVTPLPGLTLSLMGDLQDPINWRYLPYIRSNVRPM